MVGSGGAITREQWSHQGKEAVDASFGRITAEDADAYRCRGVRWTFGDVIISDSVQSPCRISRANDDTSGDQNYITVFFVLSGGYTVFDDIESIVFERGAAGWMPGWCRVSAENRHLSRLACVSVPRTALRAAGHRRPAIGHFSPSSRLATPALSFLLELMHTADERSTSGIVAPGRTDVLDADVTGAVLAQLVAGLFLEQTQLHLDSLEPTPGLWAQGVAIIDREYADLQLDPTTLADRLHVSLRHLQRSFAQQHQTISDAVRERRASAVVDILSGAPETDISLSEVAGLCGFTSIKEMRFALRTKYATTPRELRSAAHATLQAASG